MRSMLWPPAALALTVVVALLGAGCGGGGASDPSTGATGGATAAEAAAKPSRGMQFAACMRENGVRDFPDPDASGELTVDAVANEAAVDTNGPAWEAAIAACRDLQPAGFTGRPRDDQQQSAALEFAECMRRSGVPDFPDPAQGEPLVDTNRIPSSNTDGGMEILDAAMAACGDEGRRAMGSQP